MRFILILQVSILLIPAELLARAMEENEILETFDPFGQTDQKVSSEESAVDKLRPKWMFSLAYSYTYRTGFPNPLAEDAVEQLHMWTGAVTYTPWTFFFAGAALPVGLSKFEGTSRPQINDGTIELLPEYDWTGGLADLSTCIGSELPFWPVTLMVILMWPTGDIEKGMGTGEFSLGFTADVNFPFDKVNLKLGGFYFFLKDPVVTQIVTQSGIEVEEKTTRSLPDSFGAKISASIPVSVIHLGVGFQWSRKTLITWDTVHVLEPSVKVVWPITTRWAAVLDTSMEVYPTWAITPTLALAYSI